MKRKKNAECAACLKYPVSIFVEKIFKMQRLEVSCAVRPKYFIRRQMVKNKHTIALACFVSLGTKHVTAEIGYFATWC